MTKFIHAADLHIDTQFVRLQRYEGAPHERVKSATRRALENLVDTCLTEKVAFLAVAGDIFDYDWKDFSTALFVAGQFRRLDRAKIPVYLIFGNHDAREEISRRTPWPGNVHIFSEHQPESKSLRVGDVDFALHGFSFKKRVEDRNLVPKYPSAVRGAVNVGLLHTSAEGSPGHAVYAPCSVQDLEQKGYDYWALGHVHGAANLSKTGHVWYSGVLQGRHIREEGEKGCQLVEVNGDGIARTRFVQTDVLRWFHKRITLSRDDDLDAAYDRATAAMEEAHSAADGRLAAVRLTFEGACRAHRELVDDRRRQEAVAELRSRAGNFADELWLEKISFDQLRSAKNLDRLRQGNDLVGQLLREIRAIAADREALEKLASHDGLQKLAAKVDGHLSADDSRVTDPVRMAAWLQNAEQVLLDRLGSLVTEEALG